MGFEKCMVPISTITPLQYHPEKYLCPKEAWLPI
jgi:hypothetical protein